jgi:phosphatidylserine/phosphatidylglycerophosphate/cardiolipin synthase-like enzyme
MYLDSGRLRETEGSKAFQALAETPSVEIRVKQESSALVHLKSYQADGHMLHTGAANFSASGLKLEDDDLIVIESLRRQWHSSGISRRDFPRARYCRLAYSQ